jgi:MFS family permease
MLIIVLHSIGAFVSQVAVSSLADHDLSWRVVFIAVSLLAAASAVGLFAGFVCSNFVGSDPARQSSLEIGFLEGDRPPAAVTRLEFASLTVQLSFPTAALLSFGTLWAGAYLTRRFGYSCVRRAPSRRCSRSGSSCSRRPSGCDAPGDSSSW